MSLKKGVLIAAVFALAVPARADDVRLTNGAFLEGVVQEKGDTVVVEMDIGSITLPRSEIRSITRSRGPLQEFEERRRAARDPAGLHALAVWAEKQELQTKSHEVYRRIIEIDPDHKEARRALGYTLHDGRWLTENELMTAKGLVLYDGRWMTPEERSKELERQMELQERAARAQAQEEERRRAETARAALDRARTEALRQNAQWTSWVPVPWSPLPWSPYRVSGFAESQQLPSSGVPQQLPLSGVPQQLPASGVPQQLPLSGTPQQLPEAR